MRECRAAGARDARRYPRPGSRPARRDERLPSPCSTSAQLLEHDRVDQLDSFDPLFEVFGSRPACECRLELSVVAEPGPVLTELVGECVVDRQPFLTRRGAEERAMEAVQSGKLADRIRVVVDAQVDG